MYWIVPTITQREMDRSEIGDVPSRSGSEECNSATTHALSPPNAQSYNNGHQEDRYCTHIDSNVAQPGTSPVTNTSSPIGGSRQPSMASSASSSASSSRSYSTHEPVGAEGTSGHSESAGDSADFLDVLARALRKEPYLLLFRTGTDKPQARPVAQVRPP